MNKYKRLLAYAFREWPALAVILILSACTSGLAALQPWPIKLLVDYGLGLADAPAVLQTFLSHVPMGSEKFAMILVAAAAGLVVFAIGSALDLGLTLVWSMAGQRMVYALASDLFRRLQRLSLLFHSRRSVGDSLSRLTGDTWCVYSVVEGLLISPLQQVLTLATVGAVAWRLDPKLAAMAMAVAPLLGASAFFFGRRLKQRARLNREARARLTTFVHQTISAIPVVQAFGTEQRNTDHFLKLADQTVLVTRREALMKNAYTLVNGLATTVGMALILYMGGRRAISGEISVGSMLVLVGYIRTLQGATQGLLGIYGNMKSVEASMDRVIEILDSGEEVKEPIHPVPLPALPRGQRGHVSFAGVTFGYDPERPVLRNITLDARPGETLAIVGSTGAGKSTLVSLIPRLYDPTTGRILLDGIDIRNVRLTELRSHIAVVLQDPFLLPLSVAQNIAFGRTGAGQAEIVAAAEAANAAEFIRRLPEGYETVLGERGAALSTGQKQRLSIARALLKDASILILDEPTSALDVETEQGVMEAVDRLVKGRTTFIVAHRMSTIRSADRIIVLENGRMIEMGSHEELWSRQGAYFRLYVGQSVSATREVVA